MTEIPHFSLPFRFGPHAAVSEQDSIDEIADCVLAVIVCPLGFRVELPTFGVADLVFTPQPFDTAPLRGAVDLWEPRAQAFLTQSADALDELVAHTELLVQVRTGG